jgi:hypothetical protein
MRLGPAPGRGASEVHLEGEADREVDARGVGSVEHIRREVLRAVDGLDLGVQDVLRLEEDLPVGW